MWGPIRFERVPDAPLGARSSFRREPHHAPLPRPSRSSRRARSGGMSRGALVTDRRQSAHDKTRVSSINKRRVTPVPRSARRCRRDRNLGARPERELPSRCRTPRRSWGAAPRASPSARTPGGGASPLHSPDNGRWGCVLLAIACSIGLPSHRACAEGSMIRRSSRHPTSSVQTARIPANQSRLRAFRRWRSTGSSPMGSGSLRPSQRSDPDSPRLLTNEQMLLPARRTTMHSPTTSPSATPTLARERFLEGPRRPSRRVTTVLPREAGRLDRVAV